MLFKLQQSMATYHGPLPGDQRYPFTLVIFIISVQNKWSYWAPAIQADRRKYI